MAGFNFQNIKDSLSKLGTKANAEEFEREDDLYEDDYYEDDYEEDDYEEGDYEEDEYEEDGYDASYDYESEDGYANENAYEDDPEDGYEDYADDRDSQMDSDEYDSDEYEYTDEYAYSPENGYPYDEEEEDAETLGYNPAIFANLDNDEGAYYDDENGEYAYDDEYDDQDQYYDDEYEEYDDQPEEEKNPSFVGGLFGMILDNDWFMYAMLILLAPVGIWLLWRRNKFDITLRTTISAISLIWFIILIILLIPGAKEDPTYNPPDPNFIVDYTQEPTPTETPAAPQETNNVTEPSTTPHVQTGAVTPGTTGSPMPGSPIIGETAYVYITNTGEEYHYDQNCGGLMNASKVTLETALTRAKIPCATCAGGTTGGTTHGSTTTTNTFYATNGGTWYHRDSSCQGMLNAKTVTEVNAIQAGKTACPVCIGYYGTPGGTWYHSVSNCQSMQNAITKTKEEWEALKKTACPVCMKKTTGNTIGKVTDESSKPDQTMVYATQKGTWYHTDKNCQGMANASYISIQQAVSANKTACPKCITINSVYVFATQGGKYYHTKHNCTGMKNAQYVKASAAIALGKDPCPACAKMLAEAKSSGSTNNLKVNVSNQPAVGTATGSENLANSTGFSGQAVTQTASTYVYATDGGTWMHLKKNCSGMVGAKHIPYETAAKAGKKICPECFAPTALTVYATSGGKYFHTISNCSGMKNAVPVTMATAVSYGKKACSTCAKELVSTTTTFTNTDDKKGGGGTKPTSTPKPDPDYGSANSTVYLKLGEGSNNYYHTAAKCNAQGVTGATNVTLEYAVRSGFSACPSCNPPSKIY